MTATACSRLGAALLGLVFGAAGCSASSGETQSSGETVDASSDAGSGCLLCSDASTSDAPLVVRVKETLDQVCGNPDGCHGSGAGNMGVTIGAEFTALIDVPSSEDPSLLRVRPGDPDQSYVYRKLACDGGIFGSCMPLSIGFDPTYAKMFHDWIEAGAPVN